MNFRGIVAVTAALTALVATGGWATGKALSGSTKAAAIASSPSSAQASPTMTAAPIVPPTLSPQEALDRAKRSVVRLEPDNGQYSGSGTVVSAAGLILTNAHVAEPRAPGLAYHYALSASHDNPAYLTVSVDPPGDGPSVVKYRAKPLVADGYLDLALVQIDALADGSPLPAGLAFSYLPVAAVDRAALGDPLTVLGYPGVAGGSQSLSVTPGGVATFLPDPQKRVKNLRWEIDTSARIAGGNSGGAAINAAGQLIGVPSATVVGQEYSGRIRPIALAEPLLLSVADGSFPAYRTPYDVVGTGQETATPLGWSTDGTSCGSTTGTVAEGAQRLDGAEQVAGMTPGEDVLVELVAPDHKAAFRPQLSTWTGAATGCLSASWSTSASSGFGAGGYEMRVYVGPQLRQVTVLPLSVQPGAG